MIHSPGFRSLAEGESVEFVVEEQDNGKKRAADVTGPNGDFVQVRRNPSKKTTKLDSPPSHLLRMTLSLVRLSYQCVFCLSPVGVGCVREYERAFPRQGVERGGGGRIIQPVGDLAC